MNSTLRLARFRLRDLLRGRWLIAYALLFAITGELLLRLGSGDGQALLSLTNLVLFVVPLVCLVFGTTYIYDARDFNELLLAQPVSRRQLFGGLYTGLAFGLSIAFLAGAGTPFLLHGMSDVPVSMLVTLLAAGVMLTLVFVAVAFLIAVRARDKTRGLAAAIAVWLLATLVYDGVVLLVASTFAAYPLERAMIGLMMLNPVDLARVLLLMQLDVAALMGYTGAVFERFFGSGLGIAIVVGALASWIVGPALLGLRAFQQRDF